MHHAASASNSHCKNKHIVCKSSGVFIQEFFWRTKGMLSSPIGINLSGILMEAEVNPKDLVGSEEGGLVWRGG